MADRADRESPGFVVRWIMTILGEYVPSVGGWAYNETILGPILRKAEAQLGKEVTVRSVDTFIAAVQNEIDKSPLIPKVGKHILVEFFDEFGDGLRDRVRHHGGENVTEKDTRDALAIMLKRSHTFGDLLNALEPMQQTMLLVKIGQYAQFKNDRGLHWRHYRGHLKARDLPTLAAWNVNQWDVYLVPLYGTPGIGARTMQEIDDLIPDTRAELAELDARAAHTLTEQNEARTRQANLLRRRNPNQPEELNVGFLIVVGVLSLAALVALMTYL